MMAPTEEDIASAIQHKSVTRSQSSTNVPPASAYPRAQTPPPAHEKRRLERDTHSGRGSERSRSRVESAVDPNQLSKALQREFEEPRSRDVTPGGSPVRKRQRVYGDR